MRSALLAGLLAAHTSTVTASVNVADLSSRRRHAGGAHSAAAPAAAPASSVLEEPAFMTSMRGLAHRIKEQVPADASPFQALDVALLELYKVATAELAAAQRLSPQAVNPLPDGYYRVLPEFMGAALPNAKTPLSFASPCLTQNTFSFAFPPGDSLGVLTVTSAAPNASNPFCADMYLVAHPRYVDLITVSSAGTKTVKVTVPAETSTWVGREGVRVFRFLDGPLQTIADAVATLSLYVPALTSPTLDLAAALRSRQFLKDYVNVSMPERANPAPLALPPGYLGSGDLMVITRLDGLGVLEDWGTGAASTHTVALFDMEGDGKLWVVESTDKTSYWPNPNIQATPIDEWMQLAVAANYSVVHLPLKAELAAKFDAASARAFIKSSLGLPYGYHNFVFTFLDTPDGNLPYPASWQFVEIAANLLTLVAPDFLNSIFAMGANKRLGTTNLTLIQVADLAAQKGMTWVDVLTIPEQDSWVYPDGPSMVCDVFYCRVVKAGGLFGPLADSINCGEFHNLDVYRLNIFDMERKRPAVCEEADPTAPYCQLMGLFAMELTHAGTMEPYAHMNEHCAALPLGYVRTPANC